MEIFKTKFKLIISFFLVFLVFFGVFFYLIVFEKQEALKSSIVAQTKNLSTLMFSQKHDDIDLQQILKNNDNIINLHFIRSPILIKEYGIKEYNKKLTTDLQRKSLLTKETIYTNQNFSQMIYYPILSLKDCQKCHNSKEFASLGLMEVEFIETSSISYYSYLIFILFVLLLAGLFVFYYKNALSYIVFFQEFQKVKETNLKRGSLLQIDNSLQEKKFVDLINWINSIFTEISNVENKAIERSHFLIDYNGSNEQRSSLSIIKDKFNLMADNLSFKKEIEKEKTSRDVFQHFVDFIKTKFKVKNITIYEVYQGEIIFTNKTGFSCDFDPNKCEALNGHEINDTNKTKEFCSLCGKIKNYICFDVLIREEHNVIINIMLENSIDVHNTKQIYLGEIKNFTDIFKTEYRNKIEIEELKKGATIDTLTGIYNRKFLENNLITIQSQIMRTDIEYGILMCDIDHFKSINDTYGHSVGDEAIRVISRVLKETTRDSDILIRWGGEEFLIMLYNCEKDSLEFVAEKIRNTFKNKKIMTGPKAHINKTISLGGTMFNKNSESFEEVVNKADEALYQSKNNGRDKTTIVD